MNHRINLGLATLIATAMIVPVMAADKKPSPPRKRDPDAVRCVRSPVTGSLAQFQRVCMTNREWDQQNENARNMQSLICSDQSRCGGR